MQRIFAIALLSGALSANLSAVTISTGNFSFGGTIFVTNPEASAVVTPGGTCPANTACIFWQDGAGTTNGEVDISTTGLPNGNIPLAIAGNNAANISSLMNPPDVVGTFPPTLFMSFNNDGITTTLDITQIFAGVDSPADCGAAPESGQTCTVPGSFVNFANNPPPAPAGTPCGGGCQATATFSFAGTVIGNTPTGGTWTGNFTSQFPLGMPYQNVLGELAANGFVANTFSGTITLTPPAAIPEPAPITLMGAGLLLMTLGLRRRKSAAR